MPDFFEKLIQMTNKSIFWGSFSYIRMSQIWLISNLRQKKTKGRKPSSMVLFNENCQNPPSCPLPHQKPWN
jgi:hypothetical protein